MTVMMKREGRDPELAPLNARYGVVIERDGTYACNALEGIMAYVRRSYHFISIDGTTEEAMEYFAGVAKEQYDVDVDTSSYRSFLMSMPPSIIAFYEDESFPISSESEYV